MRDCVQVLQHAAASHYTNTDEEANKRYIHTYVLWDRDILDWAAYGDGNSNAKVIKYDDYNTHIYTETHNQHNDTTASNTKA